MKMLLILISLTLSGVVRAEAPPVPSPEDLCAATAGMAAMQLVIEEAKLTDEQQQMDFLETMMGKINTDSELTKLVESLSELQVQYCKVMIQVANEVASKK